jgi:NAD(P)-dependent dehydrogenase (short-subunit alcohol dehydrogenase family)
MKNILITGSSRGIGLALVREFAVKGWNVCATARDPSASAQLSRLHHEYPGRIRIQALDVLSTESCEAAATELRDAWNAIDVLVNNAAVFPGTGAEPFEENTPAMFLSAFDCNVVGVVRVTAAMRSLLPEGAAIVNISSLSGSIGEKDDSSYYSYAVSKAALNMLTRTMAAEFKPLRIAVTAISPGWVRTDMGGESAPLSPSESAADLYKRISNLDLTATGSFTDRFGENCPW